MQEGRSTKLGEEQAQEVVHTSILGDETLPGLESLSKDGPELCLKLSRDVASLIKPMTGPIAARHTRPSKGQVHPTLQENLLQLPPIDMQVNPILLPLLLPS
jgi:hypothetical protein